jgi:hypothetical protein
VRSLTSAPARRTLGVWLGILAAGLVLLYARYDFNAHDDQFAQRGFVLSAYLFVILLPTVFYLSRWLLASETAARWTTGVIFVITTLPYHLLGLDGSYYYRDRPHFFSIARFPPSLEFFPGGTLHSFPWDWLFMPLLFALGAGLIWGIWKLRARNGRIAARTIPILLTVAFAVICAQTYLHTSMRSPYTYLAHFTADSAAQQWYHVYHFADGSGATEGDQYAFSPLEDYFQGAHHSGYNGLIRRPLSFYLASQGSFFVNTFYVWLVLNCLFWLAAVLATGRLVTRLATERAGIIAAALVVAGPGFLAFVGTPAMYMQYYVAVVVALCLFEELIVRPPQLRAANFLLFTGVLTLCALVYDMSPLLVFLFAYGLARKVPWKPLLGSLVAAGALTLGFTLMVSGVLGIEINPANGSQVSDGLHYTKELLINPSPATWYDVFINVVTSFVSMLLHSMFVIPVLVALFGIRLLKDRPRQVFVGGLFLVTLLTMAILQIGGTTVGYVPRLVYPVFPAVYLLAALALDTTGFKPRLDGPWAGRAIDRLRIAAPWIVIGVMLVFVNMDIFGYPTQYVEFFTNTPPRFVP